MDKQSRLLDIDYLTIRIQELKPIRRKELQFRIEKSNRIYSNTKYIVFYTNDGTKYKAHTLRISDHKQIPCIHSEFLVQPNEDLTKKKKESFMKALELAAKKALEKTMYKGLKEISQEKQTWTNTII